MSLHSESNRYIAQDLDQYLDEFRKLTKQFLSGLDDRNVAQINTQAPNLQFNNQGRNFNDCLAALKEEILPNLSASAGGRYWGFVTGGANPAALFADWLVSTFDQNVAKGGDSIATDIERQMLDWLKELFYLPAEFKGIITTGATAANFLAAVVARQYAGHQQSINVAQDGLGQLNVEVFSACPHASMIKALGLAGIGQKQITRVNCNPNSEQMNTTDLAAKLKLSNAKAKIVIASTATVTATSFDDLTSVSSLCQQHRAWLHVDAAFGLFERVVNGENGLTKGIEKADSITVDFHKWLNVPYDAGAFYTKHQNLLVESCEVTAPYLMSDDDEPEFMGLGIENSRRFRAFPIWYTLLSYGREGIVKWVDANINTAKALADWLAQHNQFELMIECQLNVVLFRPNCQGLSNQQADARTTQLLNLINQDGKLFLSSGVWQGQQIIRAALSNWQTNEQDLSIAKESLVDCVGRL